MTAQLNDYFQTLETQGIKLSEGQKRWYISKYNLLKEDMLREYPSTADEAFAASQEGNWYAEEMKQLYASGHVTDISYDRSKLVHTAWDLGQFDFMCIWFFQMNAVGEILLIDYFQKSKCPIDHLVHILQAKGYSYGTHIWPHDAMHKDKAGINFKQQMSDFNIFGECLEVAKILDGINLVRLKLNKCWFDKTKCAIGLACLENYSKTWNNQIGGWSSIPNHNDYSHGADAFRYLISGLDKVRNSSASLENDAKALRAYWGG